MAGITHTSPGTILTQAEYEGTGTHTGLTAQTAVANSNLTLTGSAQDVAGATLTLAAQGTYLVWAVFEFSGTAGDALGVGYLVVNGSAQTITVICDLPGIAYATLGQVWLVTTSGANQVVKLQGAKSGGTGTSSIVSTRTAITALRIT